MKLYPFLICLIVIAMSGSVLGSMQVPQPMSSIFGQNAYRSVIHVNSADKGEVSPYFYRYMAGYKENGVDAVFFTMDDDLMNITAGEPYDSGFESLSSWETEFHGSGQQDAKQSSSKYDDGSRSLHILDDNSGTTFGFAGVYQDTTWQVSSIAANLNFIFSVYPVSLEDTTNSADSLIVIELGFNYYDSGTSVPKMVLLLQDNPSEGLEDMPFSEDVVYHVLSAPEFNSWNRYSLNITDLAIRYFGESKALNLKINAIHIAAYSRNGAKADTYVDALELSSNKPADQVYSTLSKSIKSYDSSDFRMMSGERLNMQNVMLYLNIDNYFQQSSSGTRKSISNVHSNGDYLFVSKPGVDEYNRNSMLNNLWPIDGMAVWFSRNLEPYGFATDIWDYYLSRGIFAQAIAEAHPMYVNDTYPFATWSPAQFAYADDNSPSSIVESIAQGRSFIEYSYIKPTMMIFLSAENQIPMGKFPIYVDSSRSTASLDIDILNIPSSAKTLRLIRNGTTVGTIPLSGSSYDNTLTPSLPDDAQYFRIEILDSNSTILALSNPVVYVKKSMAPDIWLAPNPSLQYGSASSSVGSVSYAKDTLSFTARSRENVTLTTKVFALKVPSRVTGADSWSFDPSSNITSVKTKGTGQVSISMDTSPPPPGTSWNPKVSCTPVKVKISDITADSTGSDSFTNSPFTPGIKLPSGAPSGSNAKRWLTDGNTPPGWISPGPPCTITNNDGDIVGVFAEIDGVKYGDLMTEDFGHSYNTINGGGSWGNDSWGDTTFNIYDPVFVPDGVGTCTSPTDPTCYSRLHLEIDRDWKAAGYCGAGTACDENALYSQTKQYSTVIDVQGFIYWDPGHVTERWHSFNGWELHPLTAWRSHDGDTTRKVYVSSDIPSSVSTSIYFNGYNNGSLIGGENKTWEFPTDSSVTVKADHTIQATIGEYVFDHWTLDGTDSNNELISFTTNRDHVLVARYTYSGASKTFDQDMLYRVTVPFQPAEHTYSTAGSMSQPVYHQVDIEGSKLVLDLNWDSSADLDLFIYNTSGRLVNYSVSAGESSEQVSVENPENGIWTVRIIPYSLNGLDSVQYSLDSTQHISAQLVDTDPPQVSIIEPVSKTYDAGSINIAFTSVDDMNYFSSCSANMDESSKTHMVPADDTISFSKNLYDGEQYLRVTCSDGINTGSSSVQFYIGTSSLPQVAILSPNGIYNSTSIPLSIVTLDFSKWIMYSVDDAENVTACNDCTNFIASLDIAEGSHLIKAYVSDYADRTNIASSSFTVDTMPTISSVQLLLDGMESDKTYERGDMVNITALFPPGGHVIIESNFTGSVAELANGDGTVTSMVDTSDLSGTYNITAYFSGDQNHAGSSVTRLITVKDTVRPAFTKLLITPITPDSFHVIFSTNEKTYGKIEYGKSEAYGNSVEDDVLSTYHDMVMSGLDMSSLYYIKAGANDMAGNSNTLSDSFTTGSSQISNISANTVTTFSFGSVSIDVVASDDIENAQLNITVTRDNPASANPTAVPLKYLSIDADQRVLDNFSYAIIKSHYSYSDIAGMDEDELRILLWDGAQWVAFDPPEGGVDNAGKYVWANVSHFSTYSVGEKFTDTLALNSNPTWSVTEGTQTIISCSNTGTAAVNINRDGSEVPNPDTQTLPTGSYVYTCSSAKAVAVSNTLTVTPAAPSPSSSPGSSGGGGGGGGIAMPISSPIGSSTSTTTSAIRSYIVSRNTTNVTVAIPENVTQQPYASAPSASTGFAVLAPYANSSTIVFVAMMLMSLAIVSWKKFYGKDK